VSTNLKRAGTTLKFAGEKKLGFSEPEESVPDRHARVGFDKHLDFCVP
jgi:hypothetical protein